MSSLVRTSATVSALLARNAATSHSLRSSPKNVFTVVRLIGTGSIISPTRASTRCS